MQYREDAAYDAMIEWCARLKDLMTRAVGGEKDKERRAVLVAIWQIAANQIADAVEEGIGRVNKVGRAIALTAYQQASLNNPVAAELKTASIDPSNTYSARRALDTRAGLFMSAVESRPDLVVKFDAIRTSTGDDPKSIADADLKISLQVRELSSGPLHAAPASASASASAPTQPASVNRKRCKFYARGKCKFGTACWNIHDSD